MTIKPEWNIYKNDIKIGQAITWHKALSNLLKLDNIHKYTVEHYAKELLFIKNWDGIYIYKIVKERG